MGLQAAPIARSVQLNSTALQARLQVLPAPRSDLCVRPVLRCPVRVQLGVIARRLATLGVSHVWQAHCAQRLACLAFRPTFNPAMPAGHCCCRSLELLCPLCAGQFLPRWNSSIATVPDRFVFRSCRSVGMRYMCGGLFHHPDGLDVLPALSFAWRKLHQCDFCERGYQCCHYLPLFRRWVVSVVGCSCEWHLWPCSLRDLVCLRKWR